MKNTLEESKNIPEMLNSKQNNTGCNPYEYIYKDKLLADLDNIDRTLRIFLSAFIGFAVSLFIYFTIS